MLKVFSCTGIYKKRGKYVFLGLSGSGKNILIKQLLEEGHLDSLPYVDSAQLPVISNDYGLNHCEQNLENGKYLLNKLTSHVSSQAYGRNLASYSS